MLNKLILTGLFLCALSHSSDFSESGAGTTSLQFLKIGVGARPIAMGEAFCAVAEGAETIHWNPAGLSFLKRPEMSFTHTVWFETINYESLAVAYPISKKEVVGVLINYLSMGLIDKYDNTGTKQGTFDAKDMSGTVSFATRFINALPLGINIKLIRSRLDDRTIYIIAGDAGCLYSLNKELTLGLSVQNIGMTAKFDLEEAAIPLNIKAGCAYRMSNLLVAVDANFPIDNSVIINSGAEYNFKISKAINIAARAGYRTNVNGLGGLAGLTTGVGFSIEEIVFDYAYIPFGDLGNSHRASIKVRF